MPPSSEISHVRTQLTDIQVRLGRIEGALSNQGDLRKDVQSLERRVNWATGAATILGAFGGAIVSYFAKTHS